MSVDKLKIKSPAAFASWLRRFKGMDRSLLIELSPDKVIAKSYTIDRATIKRSVLNMADFADGKPSADILLGVFDIGKVIDIFKHFEDKDEIEMAVHWAAVNDLNIAEKVVFKGKKLKYNILMAEIDDFEQVSEKTIDLIKEVVEENKVASFPFTKEIFTKINSLSSMDSSELLTISVADKKVHFKGKSFDYDLDLNGSTQATKDVEFSFYKTKFAFIDNENSSFNIAEDRVMIYSDESETMITIGRVEE